MSDLRTMENSNGLKSTTSNRTLQTGISRTFEIEKKSIVQIDAPFGKTRKTINENIKCFYVQSLKLIQTPLAQRTKKIISNFMKYYGRVAKYLKNDDEQIHKAVVSDPYFIQSIYVLLLDGSSLEFEFRKEIFVIFKIAAKIRNLDDESIMVKSLKESGKIFEIRDFQLSTDFQDNGMIGLMGSILRFFAKFHCAYTIFLDVGVISKLFECLKSSKFHLSSEAEATLNALFFLQLDPDRTENSKVCSALDKRRKKINEFMTKNCGQIFGICKDIAKESSYMYTRTSQNMFFRIFSEEYLKTLKMEFINRLENIIIVLNFQKNENSSIRCQACQLLSIFLKNYDKISEGKLKSILYKNKSLLSTVVGKIKIEDFDEKNESSVSIPDLVKIIENIPECH